MRLKFAAVATLALLCSAFLVSAQVQFYTISRPLDVPVLSHPGATKLMRIDRPAAGTFQPGVVIVKTREAIQVEKGDKSLVNATLPTTLSGVRPNGVRYALLEQRPKHVDMHVRAAGLDRIYELSYEEPIDPFDLCVRLMQDPSVEYAVPKRIHQLTYTPNDPRFASQGGVRSMGLQQAWDISKGSRDVIVAIIDSGTDIDHEDLSSQLFVNTKEIAGNNIDDDGNGFVDDVTGWDFVGNVSPSDIQAGRFRPDNDVKVRSNQMNDNLAHGTSVAGCATARADNARGIAGSGFNVTLLPIKTGSDNPNAGGIHNGYAAIRYAADMGAHIINCSWGGAGNDPAANDAIAYARSRGAIVVTATGNTGNDMDVTPFFPASSPGAFSVGSISNTDRGSSFSNFGTRTAVFAPGEDVITTYPGNQYRQQTGTSFSAPLASGVLALLKAIHPDWTAEQLMLHVRATSKSIQNIDPSRRGKFFGAIDAEVALTTNRTFTSGDRMPGIVVRSLTLSNSGAVLTTREATQAHLNLRNILAPTIGGVVTVRSLDPRCAVRSSGTITFGTMGHNDSTAVQFTIDPDDTYPWYQNTITLEISIQSGAFFNIEYVDVPFSVPTSNQHAGSVTTNFIMNGVASVGSNEHYAVGSLGGTGQVPIITRFGGSQGIAQIPFVATAFAARANGRFWIGGLNTSGVPTISRSTNSGGAWGPVSVATSLRSLSDIVMLNDNEGLGFGLSASTSSRLGIVRTTNGGQTWEAASSAPQMSGTNEQFISGAIAVVADTVWGLTSAGRIARSPNRGTTWSSAGINAGAITPVGLGFQNARSGIVVFSPPGAASTFRVANTADGGTTWTVVPGELNFGATPVRVVSRIGHVLVVCSDGAVFGTDDGGVSWNAVLSRPSGTVLAAAGGPAASPDMLAMVGQGVYTLTYRYTSRTGPKSLAFVADSIVFGNVQPAQVRVRSAAVRNAGTGTATIQSAVIVPDVGTPDTAFRFNSATPTEVVGDGSAAFSIRFSMAEAGSYAATLRVTSDASPATIELRLTASVPSATSVEESLLGRVAVAPNPAVDRLTIALPDATEYDVTIVDVRGYVLASRTVTGPTAVVPVTLPAGWYALVIRHANVVRTIPVVIAP
jgi:photosystem II stability/assembly factor-like uncharacterized protein